VHQVGRWLRLY